MEHILKLAKGNVLMCQERFHDTLKEVPPVKAKVGVMLYT